MENKQRKIPLNEAVTVVGGRVILPRYFFVALHCILKVTGKNIIWEMTSQDQSIVSGDDVSDVVSASTIETIITVLRTISAGDVAISWKERLLNDFTEALFFIVEEKSFFIQTRAEAFDVLMLLYASQIQLSPFSLGRPILQETGDVSSWGVGFEDLRGAGRLLAESRYDNEDKMAQWRRWFVKFHERI